LPFPNDIRRKNGKIDLTGPSNPRARGCSVRPGARYMAAIEQDSTGFGVNEAIFFRFSRTPDVGSFSVQATTRSTSSRWLCSTVTPSSPEYGVISGLRYTSMGIGLSTFATRYWRCVHPSATPLRPGTTYAPS